MAIKSRGTNNNKLGYSEKSLAALERGSYDTLTKRDPKYRTSSQQVQQSRQLPKLEGMTRSKSFTPSRISTVSAASNRNSTRPSTRYNNPNVTSITPRKSRRDTTFDKDFDTFNTYRYEKADMIDYDSKTGDSVPHWQTLKKQIMGKNKWTEAQFDEKWEAYDKERKQKEADKEVQDMADLAKNHPILATLAQQALFPQTLIEGGASMLSNLFPEKYKAQSADDTLFTGTRAREAAKQTVKDEHIKSNLGKGAYDIGTSLLDMAESAAVPVLGAGSLGAQTAARTNMQALERGVDPNKAALTGATSGVISGLMNKVGLDKALGAAGKTALGTVGKAALREGAENVVEDASNLAIDKFINQNKSQLNTLHDYYVAQGMSDKEAWNQVAKDTAGDLTTSALSGAAFGGVMSGVRNIPALKAEIGDRIQYSKKGNADIQNIVNGTVPKVEADIQEVANAAKQANDAAAKIQELSQQIPKTEDKALTPDEAQKLQDIASGKNDIPETPTEQPKVENKVVNEAAKNNPRMVINLEGEERAKVESERAQVKTRKKQINEELNALKKKDKLTKAETEQKKALTAEKNKLDQQDKDLGYRLDGKAKPFKEIMKGEDWEAYNNLYGTKMNTKTGQMGTFGKLDNVAKFAGNTDEAKALKKQIKDSIEAWVESGGKTNLINEIAEPANRLDALAKENSNIPFGDKKYVDRLAAIYGSDPETASIWDFLTNDIGDAAEAVRKLDSKYAIPEETPTAEAPVTQEAPTTAPIDNGNVPPEPPIISEPPRSDNTGKSRVGTNTAVNSDVFTRDQIENDPIISELNSYAKANNDLTFNQAKENIYRDGAKLLNEYTSGQRAINNDLDVDQAMILLTNMANRIKAGDKGLETQRNLLFSRLRQAGTLYGQTIQAFKKWNNTAEGAIINGERINDEAVKSWKTQNKKKVELNGRIANALKQMGVDSSMRDKVKVEKTHDQVKEGVKNVLAKEFGSVDKYFNDNDIEFLTTLAEEKKIPVWQITDEIEHKLATGEWYTLDESTEPKYPVNQKLKNALDALVEQEPTVKEPPTLDEIKNEVRTTLDKEIVNKRGTGEFTDNDVDYLSSLIYNGATKDELTEALNTKMATGKFGISPETQQKVTDLFAYADKFDPDSKQAFDAKSAAYKLIADEVVNGASPLEKFESWRYLAMLGNPKTMVRNYVGNKMFGAVTGISNNLSAVLEAGTDKLNKAFGGQGIQRTKAVLNPVEDHALIKAAGNDGEAYRYGQLSGSKYEKGTRDAIKQQKSVFNNKLIQLYEKATDAGISDYRAVKKKYSTSLAGYMKANGLDESAFDADSQYRDLKAQSRTRLLSDAEKAKMESLADTHNKLEKARDYAVKQAEYATFHEDNAIASLLTQFSQKARNSDKGSARALGYMLEGLIPFKKTPANILRSGIEYSPLNAIKSIKDTGKLIYENTGKRKGNLEDTYKVKGKLTGREREVSKTLAADVLDDWSKTITGTGLVALGYYLKNKGILNSSNKDEKWQDDLEGIQNYSITINGKTYTLDWAAPAVMPLLVGAEISKIKDKENLLDQKVYENIDDLLGSVNAILDPIFETSMMQGIKNTMESAANEIKYNDDGAVGGIVGSMAFNTGLGYVTQGLPTLSGQIARTIDNTRRTTDTATDSSFLGAIEKQGRKMMNKIPGLSQKNTEYYDAYGRTQENSPFGNPLGNLAYQMLSPAYVRDINTTAADKSARDTYYALGQPNEDGKQLPIMDANVFPAWKSKVTQSGHKFTPEEMAKYRKESGEANYAIRDALAKNDWFNNLSGDDQTDILKKTNTLVNKIGLEANGYMQDSKDLQAYQEGGIPSLIDKWREDNAKKTVTNATGLGSSTNASKEIVKDIMNGNTEAAEQKMKVAAENKKQLDALNEKYGTEMDMSDYVKYQEKNGANGAEEHILKKQAAQEYGFVQKDGDPNYDAYDKAVSIVGDNPQALKSYKAFKDKDYTNMSQKVPALIDDNAFTAAQKGMLVTGKTDPSKLNGKVVEGAYKTGGWDGVWYYYMLKDYADANRNGRLDKNEKAALRKFMSSDSPYVTQIPNDVYYYLGNTIKDW